MSKTIKVRMGWNPEAPTAELRTSLLTYLRARHSQLNDPALVLNKTSETIDLARWIAWLSGDAVEVRIP